MKPISRVTRENNALNDEVTRLRRELEEAKRHAGGLHGDILMYSAIDSLLHQAQSLSTLISEQKKFSGPRNLDSVIKK